MPKFSIVPHRCDQRFFVERADGSETDQRRATGRKTSESTPKGATTLATSRWRLTRHRGPAGSAVALEGGTICCFVDGVEEVSRVDKLGVRIGGAASELVVIDMDCACWNEELGDRDPEGIGDALDDVDSDVTGDASLDPRDGGT